METYTYFGFSGCTVVLTTKNKFKFNKKNEENIKWK